MNITMNKTTKVMLVLFCLLTFFANLSSLPTDIMEERNIVTAREMVSDHCWLVPTMNGELRLEEPPYPTWVAAVVEELAPGSLAAQRAAAGIMGCMLTLYLFLSARYVSRRDDFAVASTVVFLTCYNLILMGRSATWDIYCHAFMMAGIYYLIRALYEDHHYRQWFIIAGIMMGLSFLSKGPVSFYALLLPCFLMLVAFPSPSVKCKRLWIGIMIGIVVVVGGWWYAYLLTQHPAEAAAVFKQESGAWRNHNVRPWYYYWRFFLEMGVWAVLMLAGLAISYWKRHILLKREYLVSITWSLLCLVLLSLMPEKKTRYLLPLLVPCSMVVGTLIVHFAQPAEKLDRFSRYLFLGNGFLMVLITLAVPFFSVQYGLRPGIIDMPTLIVITVGMVLIAAWLLWSTLQMKPFRFIAGIAAIFVTLELSLLPTIGYAFGNPDEHSIALTQQDKRLDGVPFYHSDKEAIRIELVYEAHRKILKRDLSRVGLPYHNERHYLLPCAIVTHGYAKDILSPQSLARVDTTFIGAFDDNKHSRKDKHYTEQLKCHVILLTEKGSRN